nr:unnamed protein product [Callosobruchus analis]
MLRKRPCLDTVEEQQVHSKMNYETFATILDPEKLRSFLESPSAPARKSKRNLERFPLAIIF